MSTKGWTRVIVEKPFGKVINKTLEINKIVTIYPSECWTPLYFVYHLFWIPLYSGYHCIMDTTVFCIPFILDTTVFWIPLFIL